MAGLSAFVAVALVASKHGKCVGADEEKLRRDVHVALFPTFRRHRSPGKVVVMPVQSAKTYLSTEEVAELLGFAVRTVTLWLNQWQETGGQQGIPGGFKIGKSWRVDRVAFEAWVAQKKGSPIRAAAIPLRQAP
jgi:Helix-turn-helix domain